MADKDTVYDQGLDVPLPILPYSPQKHGLKDIALFCSLIYLEAWMKAPNVLGALTNDLCCLKSIQGNKEVLDKVAETAGVVLNHYLLCLGEELVVLSFFSPPPQLGGEK